jgi:hypothetical protein
MTRSSWILGLTKMDGVTVLERWRKAGAKCRC